MDKSSLIILLTIIIAPIPLVVLYKLLVAQEEKGVPDICLYRRYSLFRKEFLKLAHIHCYPFVWGAIPAFIDIRLFFLKKSIRKHLSNRLKGGERGT